jgi:hypothetical protein
VLDLQEFTRNVRREVAKLKLLLQQYAIMSTQVRILSVCTCYMARCSMLASKTDMIHAYHCNNLLLLP